ncbi:MAG: hypothetical protein Q9168_003481 [Polycauliona sp. 1 TL-2023]
MYVWMRHGLCTALVLVFLPSTLTQTTIDTSFDVQDAYCSPEQRELLNTFVTETLQLVNTALRGIADVDNDVKVRQNLLTYLGTDRTPVDKPLTQVTGNTWWKQKQASDEVQDATGNAIAGLTIAQRFRKELAVTKKELADGAKEQRFAYWSEDYRAYEIADDTGGQFYCDDEEHLAATDDSRHGVTPCLAFAASKDPGARKNPDSYAFFALSYWYWREQKWVDDKENSAKLAEAGKDGIRYNFANGEANGQKVSD